MRCADQAYEGSPSASASSSRTRSRTTTSAMSGITSHAMCSMRSEASSNRRLAIRSTSSSLSTISAPSSGVVCPGRFSPKSCAVRRHLSRRRMDRRRLHSWRAPPPAGDRPSPRRRQWAWSMSCRFRPLRVAQTRHPHHRTGTVRPRNRRQRRIPQPARVPHLRRRFRPLQLL